MNSNAEFELKVTEAIENLTKKVLTLESTNTYLMRKVAEFENQEEKATADYFENLRNKK